MEQPMPRTITDIRRGFGTPDYLDLSQEPAGGPAVATAPPRDSMADALALKERMAGDALRDGTLRQVEAEQNLATERTGLDIEKMRVERAELTARMEAVSKGGAGGDQMGILQLILHTMSEDKKSVEQQNAELRSTLVGQMAAQNEALRTELQQQAAAPPSEHAAPAQDLGARIGELKMLYEEMRSVFGQPDPTSVGQSIDDTIKLFQMKEQHEERMADIRRDDERWRAEFGLKSNQAEVENRRAETMSSAVQQGLPAIQEYLTRLVDSRLNGNSAGAAATVPDKPPPGSKMDTCPSCHTIVYFLAGHDTTTCEGCQTPLKFEPDPPATEPTPPAPPPAAAPEPALETAAAS